MEGKGVGEEGCEGGGSYKDNPYRREVQSSSRWSTLWICKASRSRATTLKELAIADPLNSDSEPVVLLFKLSLTWHRFSEKYKRENLWLELWYHGLAWNSGEYDYDKIGSGKTLTEYKYS